MKNVPWEMVGAFFGILSFFISLIVEWNKLGIWRRVITPLAIGILVFIVVTAIPSLISQQAVPLSITQVPTTISVTATPTSQTGKVVYEENFESGLAQGFSFWSGTWQVVDDGTGNKVLEQSMGNGWTNASFGPKKFSDGIIEFRFRVISGGDQVQNVVLHYRNLTNWTGYVASYDNYYGSLNLNYHENNQAWQPMEGISGGGSLQNLKGSWITLRIEAQGKNMKVSINGKPIITASDTRVTQGEIEVGTSTNLVVQFDDFKVWDLMPK